MFFYTQNEIRIKDGDPFIASRFDATKMYMRHYSNSLFLTFVLKNGTFQEKSQASREMEICDRKMKYWARQQNFDHDKMLEECQREKRKWS